VPAWLAALLQATKNIPWNKVPWSKLWRAARWLVTAGQAWLNRNLTSEERQELAYLMARSKGRASNLTDGERQRFAALVRKAFFGAGGEKASRRLGRDGKPQRPPGSSAKPVRRKPRGDEPAA
jgi:hypothetical protein